jgi:hypothetical protein
MGLAAFLQGFLKCCILVRFPAIRTPLRHNLRHKMDRDIAGAQGIVPPAPLRRILR